MKIQPDFDPGDLGPAFQSEVTRTVFVDDAPAPAELLLMFGGSNLPERAFERAASWIERSWVERVLVCGRVGISFLRTGVPLAHDMRDGLVRSGVPAESIVVQDQSSNTFDDVRLGLAELEAQQLPRPDEVLFMSKAHHSGRCWRTIRSVMGPGVKLHAATYDYSCEGQLVTRNDWWRSETARRHVWAEYRKINEYPDLRSVS